MVVSGHYQGLSATFGGITFPNNSGNNNLDFFVSSVNNVIPDTCPIITVPIIATQTTFCEGDSVELKVNNPYAVIFQWYKDGLPIPNANKENFWASESGLYTIGINENTVCLLPSTDILLTKFPNPILILPADTTICYGETIDITAITNATDIIWSSGDTSMTTTLSSNELTIATVNLNGCETSEKITIGNRLLPNIQLAKNEINTLIASGGVFYDWYFGDSLYVSGEDSVFQALEYGTYQVIGYDEYGCKNSQNIDIQFINCDEVKVFPNPSNGVFTVRTIPETIETIIIYNTLGQKIYERNDVFSNEELLILKAELSGGTYFISIKTANCTTLQKIVIGI
ncbi:MAG: T9SS type A sorting domain-containing protein [Saprospiraceae bacterium]|nr:T9SS type A sorting domain-containing protein [Saprospiraceae bacterium]